MQPLAQDHVVILESQDPQSIYTCSPGIAKLPGGRLVVTDGLRGPGLGPDAQISAQEPGGPRWIANVFTSDDRGASWAHRCDLPIVHARPFVAGNSLYILGHAYDLTIARSDDDGATWSDPVRLTDGQFWHQAPSNVHYAHGCVYLVMERRMTEDVDGWYVGELAPVLMRARLTDDLTLRESWSFASVLSFRYVLPQVEQGSELDYFGVPFFPCPYPIGAEVAPGRRCNPMGWLETNVVQIVDPDHYWFDPRGRTFHLWMRAHTGGTGFAAVAKVVERGEVPGTGTMETLLERAPSGRTVLFVPCPGGQMKFHILYDDVTKRYFLLSTQATDSMTRADRLPSDRYNLPNNERRRLQLHFSKNCIDWCFACLVAIGPTQRASRHYASMVIDGDDLHIVSRSGDERAKSAHDGNLVTFHTISHFRDLVY